MLVMNITFLILIFLLPFLMHTSVEEALLLDKPDSNQPFQYNVLDDLHFPLYRTTISNVIGTAHDDGGNTYIVGHIQLLGSNTPPDKVSNVPGDDLRSDNDDILLTHVARNGSIVWSRRTGSSLRDEVTGITIDPASNIYISAIVGGVIGDYGSGAVVMKFDAAGDRLWVEAYGSRIGRERLHALVVAKDASSLVAVGEASSSSALLSDVWEGGPGLSAFVILIDTKTGALKKVGHAVTIAGSSALSVSTVTTVIVNKTETVFAAGSATVSETGRTNGAVFSFSLPDLNQSGGIIVESLRMESFSAIASSLNGYSVYVAGHTYVSVYEEHDALVIRLNTTNLGIGWSVRLGSTRFQSITSIQNGAAEEHGRDVRVDEFGNVHVLIESTSRLQAFDNVGLEDIEDSQLNKRVAIVSLAPNGTVFHVIQSRYALDMNVMALEMMDEVIHVSGSVFNGTNGVSQSVLSSMTRDNATTGKHGSEFRPDVIDEDEETPNTWLETFTKRSSWIIIGCVVGVVSILAVFGVVLITRIRHRIRDHRLRV